MPLSTRLFTDSESHLIPYLAAIHANCITADSSIVTFLPPLDQDRLLRFWKDCIADVHAGRRLMVLLFDEPHQLLHHQHHQQSESPPHPQSAEGGMSPAVAPGNPGSTSGKTVEGLHLMGVVTLFTPYSETGAFRGWVEKLLVSPKFRRRGAARALMGALEEEALRRGKTLLMADTESGTVAEEMYRNFGFVEVGKIPNFATSPAGGLRDETFFYKQLS